MVESGEELASLKCVPCRGDQPLMEQENIKIMLGSVSGWTKAAGKIDKIEKVFEFKNFKKAIEFVNKVAEIAEDEGHHPDILIEWNKVTLTLWTHAIKGLFKNDFILAAKIDEI